VTGENTRRNISDEVARADQALRASQSGGDLDLKDGWHDDRVEPLK
jgi:hypothetical protein